MVQQNLDEAQSSPGLHAAAGPGLAEECASLVSFIWMCILFLILMFIEFALTIHFSVVGWL